MWMVRGNEESEGEGGGTEGGGKGDMGMNAEGKEGVWLEWN